MPDGSTNGHGPFAGANVIRVELGSGLWVDLKEYLSHADMKAIKAASMHGLIKSEGIDPKAQQVNLALRDDFDLEADELEMVRRAVKAWNFPDGQGGIAPINDATLGDLRDDVWTHLVAAMNQQYRRTAEASKNA